MEIITPLTKIAWPLRGVIFDVDGTMYNTMDHTYNRQKFVYDKLGDKSKKFEKYSDDWMDRYNETYAKRNLRGIWNEFAHANWDKNEAKIWDLYNDYNEKNPVITTKKNGVDIKDVIAEIYARGSLTLNRMTRLRLAVNTTMGSESLKTLLKKSGIGGCFDTIVTYDDVLRLLVNGKIKQDEIKTKNIDFLRKLVPAHMKEYIEKPNAISSMITLNAMGLQANEVVVFEDTVNGVLSCKDIMNGARFSSVYVVGVTWGFVKNKQKLIDAGADAIMEHPKDIIPFLEMLGAFK